MTEENKGVISPQLSPSDYIAGQETGIMYERINPSGNWTAHLPLKETQFINSFDTSACVTFSALNLLEIQLNYLANNKIIPDEVLLKLIEWGYMENGKFNFSDRFTAKMSGTTPQGNSVQKVWDSIKHDGLVPESMWPSGGTKKWTEYYQEIPQEIKDFAKKILTLLDFQYEWVVTGTCGAPDIALLQHHLQQSPLQPTHPLCARGSDNVFKTCPACVTQHATTIYNINALIEDFDHYYPYLNQYELNYPFPWIMKGVVTVKKQQVPQPAPVFNHIFAADITYGQRTVEVEWLQKGLNILGYKIPLTGYYGDITKAAVKDFQIKYKVANIAVLAWNGGKLVGPATRNKLNELLK